MSAFLVEEIKGSTIAVPGAHVGQCGIECQVDNPDVGLSRLYPAA